MTYGLWKAWSSYNFFDIHLQICTWFLGNAEFCKRKPAPIPNIATTTKPPTTTTTTTTVGPDTPCDCGMEYNASVYHRISGGNQVPTATDFPWMVSIYLSPNRVVSLFEGRIFTEN